jgi:NAD+ synthase
VFDKRVLRLDPAAEVARISNALCDQVLALFRRRGAVVGISGGVDSAVVAALCARAFGRDRVLGLLMPERDCSPDALRLGKTVAENLGIKTLVEDIGPALEALGCYGRQAEAIRRVVPEYDERWKCKLVLPSAMDGGRLNVTRLTVQSPDGKEATVRLSAAVYLQIVAATNFKQRVRKMTEYYHADRLNYAVVGTPNRLEYDQGFFVKQGDGAADTKPIAHLYKTQVYQLAEFLQVPEEIRRRAPTTDTFSLPQTQEEFYFTLPYDRMDLCLYAADHGIAAEEVAPAVELSPAQVERVFGDIRAKRRGARYLHSPPLIVQDGRDACAA